MVFFPRQASILRRRRMVAIGLSWLGLGWSNFASAQYPYGNTGTLPPPSNLSAPVYNPPATAYPPANTLGSPSAYPSVPPQPGYDGSVYNQAPAYPNGVYPQPSYPAPGQAVLAPPPSPAPWGGPPVAASPSDSLAGLAPNTQPIIPHEPSLSLAQPSAPTYMPRYRDVPVDIFVQEGSTGRFMLGGSVNSDLGVMGNITIEERNFDITKLPRRPSDIFNGAFRGGGQNFRLELVPGNQVQRYTANWTQPNLFGYSPFSLSVGGFLFSRFYRDWNEKRLGGRAAIGYEVTPDLSLTTEIRAEDVDITQPRSLLVPDLNRVLGSNDLYTGRVTMIHSTRDSPFLPTEGHYLEMIYDQGFGEFDFPRGQVNFSRYFLIRERADGTGRQTLTSSWRLGFSGADTPLFENFFAGGFTTLRGFRFRGASPVENDVQVGGRFQFIGSLEYMFPLTADDMIRMVAFVDYGTVERKIEFDWDNFRVAPGLGFRIAVPALGPAPLAFDFAVPVQYSDFDQRQIFAFSVGVTR